MFEKALNINRTKLGGGDILCFFLGLRREGTLETIS